MKDCFRNIVFAHVFIICLCFPVAGGGDGLEEEEGTSHTCIVKECKHTVNIYHQ